MCCTKYIVVTRVIVGNNGGLGNRVAIRNTGGDILPVLTTAILYSNRYVVRGYPSLSSIRASVGVLGGFNTEMRCGSGAMVISDHSVSGFRVPRDLVHRVQSSIIFLNKVVKHVGGTIVDGPNNYRLNPQPVSLRLSTLGGLNIRVSRRRKFLCYGTRGKVGNYRVRLTFPDINTARGVVLATTESGNVAMVRGTTHRPRVDSLTSFLGDTNTQVCNDNSSAVYVRNIGGLCNASRAVVPSEVITTACVTTTTVAGKGVALSGIVPSRVITVLSAFERDNYSVTIGNGDLALATPGELGEIPAVEDLMCPTFPASTNPIFVTVLSLTGNASIFIRGVFRDHFHCISRLGHLNTGVGARNGITIIRKMGTLSNTKYMYPSLHNNTTLIVYKLTTSNIAQIGGVSRVGHNCSSIIKTLGDLNTSVGVGR